MANARRTAEMPDNESEITLGLLSAVEENSRITQRSLAGDLNIALGLTNAYLKRCIHKGWIKVRMAPANRYAYYLTPTGFSEKSRLTARYLTISFNFFRASRSQCSDAYRQCEARGWRRIAFAGVSDLADIAALCAADHAVELVGVIDGATDVATLGGLKVVKSLGELGAVDAVMVTDLRNPQGAFETMAETMSRERVLTMKLLNISRNRPELVE